MTTFGLTITNEQLSSADLNKIIAHIVKHGTDNGLKVEATIGGIGLEWYVNKSKAHTFIGRLATDHWVMTTYMSGDDADLINYTARELTGDDTQFFTDMIYLKMAAL